MRFLRPLVLMEDGTDPSRVARLLRRLAPAASTVHALTFPRASPLATLTNPSWAELSDALARGDATLEALTAALADCAPDATAPPTLQGEPTLSFDPEEIEAATARADADVALLMVGDAEPTRSVAHWLVRHARTLGVPVAWCSQGAALPDDTADAHLLCPFERDLQPLLPLAAFLVDHDRPDGQVTLLGLHASQRGAVPRPSAMAEVARLAATVSLDWIDVDGSEAVSRIADEASRRGVGWLCMPFGAASGLTAARLTLLAPQLLAQLPCPLLLVPGEVPTASFGTSTRLDAPDVVITADGRARMRPQLVGALGVALGPEAQEITLIGAGRVIATGETRRGMGELELDAADLEALDALGLARRPDRRAVERVVRIVRPDQRRVALVDVALPPETIVRLRTLTASDPHRRLLGLRLRPDTPCRELSAVLARAGLPGLPILDAGLVLDDGGATDVPVAADASRLTRAARHLRLAGFAVDLVLGPGEHALRPPGFTWLEAEELEALDTRALNGLIAIHWRSPSSIGAPSTDPSATLDELTSSVALGGHQIEVELDNARGRTILLEAIASASRDLNLQSYIVQDDPLTREVEAALAAAAARGVQVRLLVDSLYSLHGSFGTHNALLARLAPLPNVTVRALRRIDGLPSLISLKQRNHRKILTVDSTLGIVTGRNLASSYYTAFHEVQLTPDTPWDRVPWLDAGACVRGPAVAGIEAIFEAAWVDAGGTRWDRRAPLPQGDSVVRIVRHEGLRDTRTLDTYLTLLRFARERVTVVNTFPMDVSIQRALLAASARGVAVRALFGHFSPRSGAGAPFPGATRLHELADEVSHGRIDRLVLGGCAAWSFALTDPSAVARTAHQPSATTWDPPALTPRSPSGTSRRAGSTPSSASSPSTTPSRTPPGVSLEVGEKSGLGWDPSLGRVQPNVHAKLMSVDGQQLAIGSANLDVTAGYWEDELLAVIDDPAVTASVDRELDRIIGGSDPIDPTDPVWRAKADRRAWLSKNWPSVLG